MADRGRRRDRTERDRPGRLHRLVRRVKQALGVGRLDDLPDDDGHQDDGGAGTREPRRPRPPVLSGGAAMALPVEADDVHAVGRDPAAED